ncbi:hypothetical protein H6P81_005794 [Aristolochia fimbriata]|uniref:Uncharacterized protein n=1 Tax=Aristolochia fimbriata TaxID=158543 RepID=A0AAV7EXN4_ARIFI|nr:hypothetical protein H6P81_005794 [Aristolochia fimbriata]
MPYNDEMVRLRRQLTSKRSFKIYDVDRDDRGWTLLHVGARKGDLKEVKRLLDEGMDVNVPAWGPKSPGVTPLHLAAEGGHLKVMDELLERGADIDARTKGACGWTPLHNAAKVRNRQAIKFLVENGAFLPDDLHDSRFNPPLHYCPALDWAYEIKRLQEETSSSSFDGSDSSGFRGIYLINGCIGRVPNYLKYLWIEGK